MQNPDYLYATCAAGLEDLVAQELTTQGAGDVTKAGAGVRFSGNLEVAYRACLWSRVANRILLPLHQGPAGSPDALYSLIRELDWSSHVDVQGSIAVDFFTAYSAITHSQYGALKVKDAIVDQFRESDGIRPDVDRQTPDIRVNVYLYRDKARIALDLSGASLHRRGYREQAGPAPLKENLAAALLLTCDWPDIAAAGGGFIDPLCGSGTLVLEAAMMASHQAPALYRSYFGFLGWRGHQPELWQQVLTAARQAVVTPDCLIVGCDSDAGAINMSRYNANKAQLDNAVDFHQQSVETKALASVQSAKPGLLLSNPPYGERLSSDAEFYRRLGHSLSSHYAGWKCALFAAKSSPLRCTKLPLKPVLMLSNGGIDCALNAGVIPATTRSAKSTANTGSSIDVNAFVNRLRKNLKAQKSWLGRDGVKAWRVYDADLPEFAVAIDVYDCSVPGAGNENLIERHLVVQEYQAPATVNTITAESRMHALLAVVPEIFSVSEAHVHVKLRKRQSALSQYEKQATDGVTGLLEEQDAVVELNFSDYLDTGLFLDHRKVRRYIQQHADAKRFLNLFAYTGSATVAAIAGGCTASVSVDLSARYCRWMERNIHRNLPDNVASLSRHSVIKSDVNKWLLSHITTGASQGAADALFDLILLDPPTFSNSTDLDADWNVQRDHGACIRAAMQLLSLDGVLIFSTNYRRFKLDPALSGDVAQFQVDDRSRWSIDRDFQRNQRIHQCWFIRHS